MSLEASRLGLNLMRKCMSENCVVFIWVMDKLPSDREQMEARLSNAALLRKTDILQRALLFAKTPII